MCVQLEKGSWSVFFAFISDNTVVGNIIYLGHYQSEFDWNNITEKVSLDVGDVTVFV